MPEWTFLTNHALVLDFLAKHPRITALEVAEAIGIRERATRRIIADLEAAGYIRKKREGRRINYRVNLELSLRHPAQRDTAIGDLLEALGWKNKQKRMQAPDSEGKGPKAATPSTGLG